RIQSTVSQCSAMSPSSMRKKSCDVKSAGRPLWVMVPSHTLLEASRLFSACQERVSACSVVGVDGVEERAHELLCALRRGCCVETVEARDGGGGTHRHRHVSCRRNLGLSKKANRVRCRRPRLLCRASDSLELWI